MTFIQDNAVVVEVRECLQSSDAIFFEDGIYFDGTTASILMVTMWKSIIKVLSNIGTIFYLYNNKHVRLINVCTLLLRLP